MDRVHFKCTPCALQMYLKALDGISAAFRRREGTVTSLPLAYSVALKIERELNQQGVGEMNVRVHSLKSKPAIQL